MIVSFDPATLRDPAAAVWLDRIFPLFEDGRHTWWVSDPGVLRGSSWYQSSAERMRRRIETMLESAKRPPGRAGPPWLLVGGSSATGNDCWCLAPEPAFRVLSHPLRLLAEDSSSDGAFLRAVLLRFGEKRLRRALGECAWKRVRLAWSDEASGDGEFFAVVHGGGGSIARVLRQQWKTVRAAILVVVDSDRRWPAEPEAPRRATTWAAAAAAVENLTNVQGVPIGRRPLLFPLAKRRLMENYLPLPALRAVCVSEPRRRAVEAYARLGVPRRHYFHLREGVREALRPGRDKPWTWKHPEQAELFTGPGSPVTEADLCELSNGLGGTLTECWRYANASNMRAEAGEDLDRLVEAVLRLL